MFDVEDINDYLLKFLNDSDKLCLKYTSKKFCEIEINYLEIIENCISYDNVYYLLFFKELGYRLPIDLLSISALNGSLNIVKWCYQNNYYPDGETLSNGVLSGNLKTVEFLLEEKTASLYILTDIATQKRDLDMLKFLNNNGYQPCSDSFHDALISGNLEIIEWFKSKGFEYDEHSLNFSVLSGNFDLVKKVYEKYQSLNADTFSNAVKTNNIGIICWLYERGCPFDKLSTKYAVTNNNLNVLKWLYEKGCPLYEDISQLAIINNNIDILDWLIMIGYQLTRKDYISSILSNCNDVIDWMNAHNCPKL